VNSAQDAPRSAWCRIPRFSVSRPSILQPSMAGPKANATAWRADRTDRLDRRRDRLGHRQGGHGCVPTACGCARLQANAEANIVAILGGRRREPEHLVLRDLGT